MPTVSEIKLFDLPTNAGCLDLGTELLPGHCRNNGLVERIEEIGIELIDLGEISVPFQPRHNLPPIRNFPLSREVWQKSESFLKEHFSSNSRGLILGLGGDCSMVVGTVAAAVQSFGQNLHLLYLDGDVDSIAPDPDQCVGSAGMGLWFLTQDSEYWGGSKISPSQITVLGNKNPPETDLGIPFVSLAQLQTDICAVTDSVLNSIPRDTHILVHLDVDLISEADMPAAYAPRKEGLTFSEVEILLKTVFKDSRTRYLEISEFVPAKDPTGQSIRALIDVLTRSLAGVAHT